MGVIKGLHHNPRKVCAAERAAALGSTPLEANINEQQACESKTSGKPNSLPSIQLQHAVLLGRGPSQEQRCRPQLALLSPWSAL